MKKITSISVIYLLSVSWAVAQKPKNDWEDMNLKGKVKSIRENKYEYYIGPWLAQKASSIIFFNEKGNKTEEENYYGNKHTYQYDDKGNKIEWKEYDRISDGGRLLRYFTYKYDITGHMIEDNLHLGGDSIFFSTYTYKYDDNGNEVEKNLYFSNGNLYQKYTYKYDDNGNLIEKNRYYPDGKLIDKFTCKYDENGNKIEDKLSFGDMENRSTWKYDGKGNMIEEARYTWIDRLHPSGKFTYEKYDKKSNWIKKIGFEKDVPMYIKERVIEYF